MDIAELRVCCDFPPPLAGITDALEHTKADARALRKAALRALRLCARGVPPGEAMRRPYVRRVGRHASVTFPSLLDSYAVPERGCGSRRLTIVFRALLPTVADDAIPTGGSGVNTSIRS